MKIKKIINLQLLLLTLALLNCEGDNKSTGREPSFKPQIVSGNNGLSGYIAYSSTESPTNYGAGVSFYTAAWQLIDQPLANFQIGLPGTWIIPDNSDNKTIPLCPIGTYARDSWPERAPTYGDVFQTLEGGLGYWTGNKYRYGAPKFSMNATSQCYDFEIASPGWSFFYSDSALPDDQLGIAQLSNRILIPPDGITFEGSPHGEFMGYSYMALPFTDAYTDGVITGEQSWTCFINTQNFKGPIAYYLPETWSKISKGYPTIDGRGLDSRPGIINGGAMEINTVPYYESKDKKGVVYTKIPKLNFPVDDNGRAVLVQDLKYYSKDALYNEIIKWRQGTATSDGSFKAQGTLSPDMSTGSTGYRQKDKSINGIESIFSTKIIGSKAFGLQWAKTKFTNGTFPQYFKEVNNMMVPLTEDEVPDETLLKEQEFLLAKVRPAYTTPDNATWKNPGPSAGPFTISLNDGSQITYSWYRFIDQPVFKQFKWTEEKKNQLQTLVEKIHQSWPIDRNYIPALSTGALISIDQNLIVNPPVGFEIGYVPIVTHQQ